MAQFGSCCLERGVAFFHHGAEGAKGRISLADLCRSGQKKQSLNSGFKEKKVCTYDRKLCFKFDHDDAGMSRCKGWHRLYLHLANESKNNQF